mgnify:FL=1|jgi:IS30 family transposase|tara:strand:+ start:798 stop:1133 length:336 start_codon:yes stop_codon:yes gene_type:complete
MLEWGMGRVEALAVQTEILTLLDQGYPVSRIYRDMQKSGQITMGRAAFYQHVSKIKRDRLKTDAPATSTRPPASKPKTRDKTEAAKPAGSSIEGRLDPVKKSIEDIGNGNL